MCLPTSWVSYQLSMLKKNKRYQKKNWDVQTSKGGNELENPWKTRDFWGSKLHHKLSIVLRRIQGFLPKMATPRLQGQPAHVANEEDIQFFQMYAYFLLGKNTRFPWLCRLQSLSHLPPRLKKYCTYDTNDLIQQLKHAHQDPLESEGFKIQTVYCWHLYCFQRWMVPTIAVGVW